MSNMYYCRVKLARLNFKDDGIIIIFLKAFVGYESGLAVGLAAKEVVGNMFGGASLFLSRPFVIGEKIKVHN